jgi:hypothetical protein
MNVLGLKKATSIIIGLHPFSKFFDSKEHLFRGYKIFNNRALYLSAAFK